MTLGNNEQSGPKPALDHSIRPGESVKDRIKRLSAEAGLPPPPWTLEPDQAEEPKAAPGDTPAKPEPREDSAKNAESELEDWEALRIAEAEENGGLAPLFDSLPPGQRWRQPRLTKVSASSDAQPPPGDAETELTALIAECRFFMREVAFNSARLTCETNDRTRFVDIACRLAETGASVGKTLAKLRGAGGGRVEERVQRIFVEHAERSSGQPAAEGGGGG